MKTEEPYRIGDLCDAVHTAIGFSAERTCDALSASSYQPEIGAEERVRLDTLKSDEQVEVVLYGPLIHEWYPRGLPTMSAFLLKWIDVSASESKALGALKMLQASGRQACNEGVRRLAERFFKSG